MINVECLPNSFSLEKIVIQPKACTCLPQTFPLELNNYQCWGSMTFGADPDPYL
jgi:hypothetical protein